jgi:hypothetical protein
MEQRFFIKISLRGGLQCRQIHLELLELYGDDAVSYSAVCYWNRQFLIAREYVEDARRVGRQPDFDVQLRIRNALEEIPLASV